MTTLIKHPEEDLLFSFDFSARTELDADTLTGTPEVDTELIAGYGEITVADITIASKTVPCRITGGTLDDLHELVCTVDTAGGRTLAAVGRLRITRV